VRNVLAAVGGAVLIFVLHTQGHLLKSAWKLWLPAIIAAGAALFMPRKKQAAEGRQLFSRHLVPGLILVGSLLIYLVSSATGSRWFYFLDWTVSGGLDVVLSTRQVPSFVLANVLLTLVFVFVRPGKKVWMLVLAVMLLGQLWCVYQLFSETGGAPIYRDDHPAFMLRLYAFGRTFPRLIYYDPFWNGGYVSPYIIGSGTTSIGTVLWPLWRLAPIEAAYTYGLAILFIVMVPLLAVGAVRIAGGSWTAAFCGGTLALGISRYYFLWLLHYGTVGACFSAAFIMPVCACVFRILWLGRKEVLTGVIFAVSGFLFLAWPASIFMAVAILPGVIASGGRWTKSRLLFIVLFGALLVALCLPYMAGIIRHSDPAAYAGAEANKVEPAALGRGFEKLKVHLRSANPLLLFLGFAGVWFFPRRGVRCFFGPVLLCLAIFSGWGEVWKPQFQLVRAGIPLFYLAVIPASLWMGRLLEKGPLRLAPARAAIAALLIFSGWNISKMYGNDSTATYCTLGGEVSGLARWIRENTPENGRVLFAGSASHGYGGGHVAYLPVLSGREMMGSDYYHFSPRRVDYNYPPRGYRESGERIFAFTQLYNVTHIITYHEGWIEKLRGNPELFEQAHTFGTRTKKTVFRVLREPDIFLEGKGAVESDVNELKVTLDEADGAAVLKYNWIDGLRADAPVEIRPFKVEEGIEFIEIDPHGKKQFSIHYTGWF